MIRLARRARTKVFWTIVGSTLSICPVGAQEADLSVAAKTGPRPDQGIPVEGWMFYPSFFAGAVFNDNVYATPVHRRSRFGLRVRPVFQAVRDNGLHVSTVFLRADAQIHPHTGQNNFILPLTSYVQPTNVTGAAGFTHVWKPLSDVAVNVTGAYTRRSGLFGGEYGSLPLEVDLPNAYTVSDGQQYSNQLTGKISIQKNLDRWFIGGSTGVNYVWYDSRPSQITPFFTNFNNRGYAGLSYIASVRGGFWVTPLLYAFAEPAAVLNRYGSSISDSNGYRVVAGLGSDLISLFRGEIYGGYNQQFSVSLNRSVSSPAFGGRIFYYPTPYLTLTTSVNQSIGWGAPTTLLGLPIALGPGSKTWQARAQVDYSFSQYWTATIRGAYGETRWSSDGIWNNGGVVTNWTAGARLNYNFWRNMNLTFDYQFTKAAGYGGTNGNAWRFINPWAPTGYSQNLVTAGLTYAY